VTVITAQTYADFKTMLGMVGDAATDSATVKTLYYAAWDTGIWFYCRSDNGDWIAWDDQMMDDKYNIVSPKTLATDFPTRIKLEQPLIC
jgi:hypothetical protein